MTIDSKGVKNFEAMLGTFDINAYNVLKMPGE